MLKILKQPNDFRIQSDRRCIASDSRSIYS
jgi:hypothetical protein